MLNLHTQFQRLMTFNSPFTGGSVLPVVSLGVQYLSWKGYNARGLRMCLDTQERRATKKSFQNN